MGAEAARGAGRLIAESASSGRGAAHASESYLSEIAFPAWLSLFGPRPNFHISIYRHDAAWLDWDKHGLAKFSIDQDGMIASLPVKAAIPERKPYWASSRQCGGRL